MGTKTRRSQLSRMAGVAAAAAAAVLFQSSLAQTDGAVTPASTTAVQSSITPPAPLPQAELDRLRIATKAASEGDWESVRALRQSSNDPLVRRMLLWRLASDRSGPGTFEEVRLALQELPGWPGREQMRRRGEQAIFDSRLDAAERIAWLRAEGGPLTGDGQAALALALAATGQRSEAADLARATWRERALTDRAEAFLLDEFGRVLRREDHVARVDGMLWRDARTDAQRLLPRLSGADRAVAEARIALQQRRSRGLQALVDRAAAARPDDPGLLYDRARYIRRTDRPVEAMRMAARIDGADAPAAGREALARERRLYIPRALRMGEHRTAYRLASTHGLTSGVEFADSEWLAGWIALRFLRDPAAAERHFSNLGDNVGTPVSRARALYWRAQAKKALGRAEEANAQLTQAASLTFTYYGQLAAQELGGRPLLTLPDAPQITPELRAEFESRELIRALRALAQVGDRSDFESIAFHLDDVLQTSAELELLAGMARDLGYLQTAVRSGKAGLRRGIVATEASYPLVSTPPAARAPGRPEPALVHAIIRQESEFDPRARSPVGARGLMQLMPATARYTARREGLAYDPTQLVDPAYNLTLGSSYLGELIDQFGGSYVLAVAAYNAGPSRSRQWIEDWGDPRSAEVDVVDWVELIPFAETRNYVMRVMENLQVYRHRMNGGEPTEIRLLQDLRRGG